MNKNIQEEILRQLQLINFDRGKTLNENDYYQGKRIIDITESSEKNNLTYKGGKSELEKAIVNYTPAKQAEYAKAVKNQEEKERIAYQKLAKEHPCRVDKNVYPDINYYDTKCPGRSAFYRLKFQIEGDGSWFSSWGTDENEVIESLEMIKTEKDYQDLRYWIQKETGQALSVIQWIQSMEFSEGSTTSKILQPLSLLGVAGMGPMYAYQTNDFYVAKIEEILSKFGYEDEKGQWEEPQDAFEALLPPAAREALHVFLPLVSLALMLVPGGQGVGGYIAAFAVEVFDSAVYAVVDKDAYAAGLALVFAFAGPLELGLGKLVAKYGSSLLKSFATRGLGIASGDFELLMYCAKNAKKLATLTKFGMKLTTVVNVLKRIKTVWGLFKFLGWLVSKGLMLTKTLAKMGLIIGGGFVGWEKINDVFFKFCNTSDLKQLSQSKTWIVKKLSNLAPYLQPYSTPCPSETLNNAIAKAINETSFEEQLKYYFKSMIKNNIVLEKEVAAKPLDVAYFQYVLYYLGLDYLAKPIEDIRKDIKKKEGEFTKQQCQDMIQDMLISGYDMVKISAHPECEEYLTPKFEPTKSKTSTTTIALSKKTQDALDKMKWRPIDQVKKDYDFSLPMKYDYGIKVPYKWGTFDEQTKLMLGEFQKKHGLKTVDGTFNSETAKKMLEFLNGGKLKGIENYGKLFDDEYELEAVRQKAIQEIANIQKNTDKETQEIVKAMKNEKLDKLKKEAEEKIDGFKVDSFEINNVTDEQIKTINSYQEDESVDKIINKEIDTIIKNYNK
jgi:hypothetical protein